MTSQATFGEAVSRMNGPRTTLNYHCVIIVRVNFKIDISLKIVTDVAYFLYPRAASFTSFMRIVNCQVC